MIYNQGIEVRVATFETRLRTPEEIIGWFDGVHPLVAVEHEDAVIAFASSSSYRARDCYAGIAEFSVYVHRAFRGHGAGRLALEGLIREAEAAAFGIGITSRPEQQQVGSRQARAVMEADMTAGSK